MAKQKKSVTTSPSTFKKSGVTPLIQVDKQELGDQRLDLAEGNARETEELLKIAAKSRVWGQDELEDAERSSGARMQSSELIRRLRNLNISLKFLDGIPGNVAVYRPFRREERDHECDDRSPNRDEFFNDHKYVSGFPLGELPEWSHVTLDSSKLPTRERRGWRTVLIGLIKSGSITYAQAVNEFGHPDSRGKLWHEQLAVYKPKLM
jgi:hypothetical protein